METYVLLILVLFTCKSLNEIRFKQFISKAIKEREGYIIGKNSMELQVNPQIAEAFKDSSMLSSIVEIN